MNDTVKNCNASGGVAIGADRAIAQTINEHFGRLDCDLDQEPSAGLVRILSTYRQCIERETYRKAEANFLEQVRKTMRN